MTNEKYFDLAAAALDFAAANHQLDDPRPMQALAFAALRYAEFAADCEADMSPPAQEDDDFSDCCFG